MSVSASIADRWGPHTNSLAVRTLAAMFEAQRLPHALLITGPVGVGKRDLAIRIAQKSALRLSRRAQQWSLSRVPKLPATA